MFTYNDVKINYEVCGEGPIILMLHGWGCQIDIFRSIINNLSTSYKVITIDFPGFGKSDQPKSTWGVPEYMECVKSFIDFLDIAPVNIIAHSFGARVVIMLCDKYPNVVNKVVITGGAGVKPKRSYKYYLKVATFKILKKIFPKKVEKLKNKYGSKDYQELNDNMRKVFVNVVNLDLTPYLSKIKSPVLLIWGENDMDTPIRMAKVMEKNIPDAGLVVLKGLGHFAYLENSQYFVKIVRNFLGS